jgi:hypothetical protein
MMVTIPAACLSLPDLRSMITNAYLVSYRLDSS